ncbi:MAG: hypothetical protein WBC60_05445 [Cognaticolwellia sp.]|jgi:hypothetical protein
MNDSLIIETYPNKLRLLAISMFLLGIYSLLTQDSSDLFGVFISAFCGGILYCSLERKSARFNNENSILDISSHSVFRKSTAQIKLSDITQIEVVKGLGSTGVFWLIKVSKEDGSYSITSQCSLSKKLLDQELKKINHYLCRKT